MSDGALILEELPWPKPLAFYCGMGETLYRAAFRGSFLNLLFSNTGTLQAKWPGPVFSEGSTRR